MKAWTCRCGRRNARDRDTCVDCEAARPDSKAAQEAPARLCPIDGGPLEAIGWCERGHGYPAGMACPFACPVCRQALTWEGRCFACHGCATGQREDWTIPGDRYELSGGHWRKVEGPQACLPPEENRARLAGLVQVTERIAARVRELEAPATADLGW